MSMPAAISHCPICGEELAVTRLHCRACNTTLEGQFRLGRFARLSPDQLAFLEAFVRNRGVIKDLEAELGISYPTVRARIDDLVRSLGFGEADNAPRSVPAPTPPTVPGANRDERRRILEDLREKRITATEAARLLAKAESGSRS